MQHIRMIPRFRSAFGAKCWHWNLLFYALMLKGRYRHGFVSSVCLLFNGIASIAPFSLINFQGQGCRYRVH